MVSEAPGPQTGRGELGRGNGRGSSFPEWAGALRLCCPKSTMAQKDQGTGPLLQRTAFLLLIPVPESPPLGPLPFPFSAGLSAMANSGSQGEGQQSCAAWG